jgi:hypothetical protein
MARHGRAWRPGGRRVTLQCAVINAVLLVHGPAPAPPLSQTLTSDSSAAKPRICPLSTSANERGMRGAGAAAAAAAGAGAAGGARPLLVCRAWSAGAGPAAASTPRSRPALLKHKPDTLLKQRCGGTPVATQQTRVGRLDEALTAWQELWGAAKAALPTTADIARGAPPPWLEGGLASR